MKYKNYYKILELDSDKATQDDIKNMYRQLAKKYHPDKNPDDYITAEKFKDINEAYHVLGNEVSKKKYDRLHFAYKFKDGVNINNAFEKIQTEGGFNELFGIFFGKNEKKIKTNLDKNFQRDIPIQGEDLESEIEVTLEEVFYGTEKKLAFRTTDGKMKTITIKVPRGIRNNEKIRVEGQGKPGKNGGANGDLYIRVKLLKHSKYKLEGIDLIVDLPLAPWEAALGCEVEVENIDSNVLITVPEGVQSGEKLRIANNGYINGYGGRGDLLVTVKIVVPKNLTKEEKAIFEKLKEISSFMPRKH